ncbi:hypothetical protein CTI12_AA474130 [Artemisia annua]|uniref:Uncharacterized protein n=1 Tax=Artemisia annua TaxID=35608 RepID=A0A2U1LMW1_ARTAN|nr:hypothetical protein CTI12_AA474130 [Artemisia annua]
MSYITTITNKGVGNDKDAGNELARAMANFFCLTIHFRYHGILITTIMDKMVDWLQKTIYDTCITAWPYYDYTFRVSAMMKSRPKSDQDSSQLSDKNDVPASTSEAPGHSQPPSSENKLNKVTRDSISARKRVETLFGSRKKDSSSVKGTTILRVERPIDLTGTRCRVIRGSLLVDWRCRTEAANGTPKTRISFRTDDFPVCSTAYSVSHHSEHVKCGEQRRIQTVPASSCLNQLILCWSFWCLHSCLQLMWEN